MKGYFEILMYDTGLDKFDVLNLGSNSESYIITKRFSKKYDSKDQIWLGCIPWKRSKYKFINWLKVKVLIIKLKINKV